MKRELAALLPDLRAYARFLVRDPSQADDLVQETLVRALAALRQFSPGTSLRAWLFTIQRNAFYEQARRRRRETRALAAGPTREEGAAPGQPSHLALAELRRHLFALSPVLREALVLVGAQGMSYEEAAAICGVPVGTMKARVARGRAQLARVFGRPVEDA